MGTQNVDLPSVESLFEAQFESSFNTVQPDPEFVSRLRRKLAQNEQIVLEPRSSATAFVLVALALFSGALMVWLLRRVS